MQSGQGNDVSVERKRMVADTKKTVKVSDTKKSVKVLVAEMAVKM